MEETLMQVLYQEGLVARLLDQAQQDLQEHEVLEVEEELHR
jgi:hypothetical protein